jgi:hypothetical protein
MLDTERDTAERDELWKSMVSQLQSRLGSMETTGELEQAKLDEPLRNELTMTAKDAFLSVWLNSDTGKGSWNAITKQLDMAEPWYMSPEGIVELSGEKMDIPHAVEHFVRKLVTK